MLPTQLCTDKKTQVYCHSVALQFVEFSYMSLTLTMLKWRMWWAPNSASKWQMWFNSAFKGLRPLYHTLRLYHSECGSSLKKLSVLLEGVRRMWLCMKIIQCWQRTGFVWFALRSLNWHYYYASVPKGQLQALMRSTKKYINSPFLCVGYIIGTLSKTAIYDRS